MKEKTFPLTKREFAVLKAFLNRPGAKTRTIANQIGCSENTVRTHLRNIHLKLNVSCTAEMLMYARDLGWHLLSADEQSQCESANSTETGGGVNCADFIIRVINHYILVWLTSSFRLISFDYVQ